MEEGCYRSPGACPVGRPPGQESFTPGTSLSGNKVTSGPSVTRIGIRFRPSTMKVIGCWTLILQNICQKDIICIMQSVVIHTL